MIPMQLNEVTYHGRSEPGFAFTITLPAVPSTNDLVFVGGRRFRVAYVEWHAFTEHPVRVIAVEETPRPA